MNKTSLVMLIVILSIAFSVSASAELTSNSSNSNRVQLANQNDNSIAHHEEDADHHHEEDADHHEHSELGEIAGALGLVTLLSLITTLILGLTMRKNPKVLMPWHKRIATFTVIVGITHGALMMYLH